MSKGNRATESISISIPGWLLEQLDEACQSSFRSRSDFVFEAIRKYILLTKDSPDFWDSLARDEE